MSNDINHSANFLASYFLTSNLSQKKIYGLKTCHIAIIRYICDSIDKNYSRRKKRQTRLYQNQIAKFTFLTRKTINKEIQHLIKKRILKLVDKNTYSIGKVLISCNLRLQRKEVSPQVTQDRCVTSGYTSNSSNITNRAKNYFETQKENLYASTAKKPSSILEEFMNNSDGFKSNRYGINFNLLVTNGHQCGDPRLPVRSPTVTSVVTNGHPKRNINKVKENKENPFVDKNEKSLLTKQSWDNIRKVCGIKKENKD